MKKRNYEDVDKRLMDFKLRDYKYNKQMKEETEFILDTVAIPSSPTMQVLPEHTEIQYNGQNVSYETYTI